ncbi:Macrolide export ATP-binding/permease protein MacB [Polystyrenella longa]|uniref:Macrolide export ATP-binding/permease protein MacB n=1 Tax=Polystyrenella longa TaxID=2528007 RepID=A0A518CHG0_9PLAN|nr:ABC transporter permease [Polystyrenella longa]QDU78667.1 Macrolide export ATP-binding/permease protein MacB [Polystyrenella longa]
MIANNTIRTVRSALKSLMLHKLRSGLTMLGIVFGVFSVIAMLAIGEGASLQAQKQVLELGATNIIIISVKPPAETQQSNSSSRVLQYGLLRSDYDLLIKTIPTVVSAVPIRESQQHVRYLDKEMNSRLVGCTEEYIGMNHLEVERGRFISEQDQVNMLNVAVIAREVADTLFPLSDPIGKSIRVDDNYFKVVGITKDRTASAAIGGSLSGQDYNKDIYIPLRTFFVRLGDLIVARQTGSFSAEQVELNQITLKVDDPEQVIATSEVVRETLEKTHARKKDYAVVVPLELLEQARQIRLLFNAVLGSIAAISLVVGGIGIMNIMLATVTERTREIGVRRALGARQRDITEQFLTETIVLSGTGGVIGVLLGLSTPLAFSVIRSVLKQFLLEGADSSSEAGRIFFEMEPQIAVWSLPLAFGISVGIGIIFGLYPARSAARLDPIEALRHE